LSQKITLYQLFAQNLDYLFDGNCPSSIAIACSGGSDSMALVMLFKHWVRQNNHHCTIHVLTIDHQLRPASTSEAHQVSFLLSAHKVMHHILTWQHNAVATKVQEQARQARYDLMHTFCRDHHIPWLMTGHHLDDQLETITMRLCSKSQLRGLAGMSAHKVIDTIHLGRPLLNIRKQRLQHFLIDQKVSWVEDPTNATPCYLRNRIRHNNQHLPLSWVDALQRYRIVEEQWLIRFHKNHCHFSNLGYWRLNWQICRKLPLNFLSVVISNIATQLTKRPYPPRHHNIINLCLMLQKDNFKSATLGDYVYCHHKDHLIIRRSTRLIRAPHQSYNGVGINFAEWLIEYATETPNLTVGYIGMQGWQQLVKFDPNIKKLLLHKSIIMMVPWLWQQNHLFDIKFLRDRIIMRENSDQDVLRLKRSYHQSPFFLLKAGDNNGQRNLNVRIAQ